jgi:hypothetical protein
MVYAMATHIGRHPTDAEDYTHYDILCQWQFPEERLVRYIVSVNGQTILTVADHLQIQVPDHSLSEHDGRMIAYEAVLSRERARELLQDPSKIVTMERLEFAQ